MQPAYYGHLTGIQEDISQWREFNSSMDTKATRKEVDPTTHKIKTTINLGFFERVFGKKTDYASIAQWGNDKVLNSRIKILNLVKDAYNSNDPKFQKESFELLSQLDAEMKKARDIFFNMEGAVTDSGLKQTLRTLGQKVSKVDEYEEAKHRLGEKLQFQENPAEVSEKTQDTTYASPLLHEETGVRALPPTKERPYWIYEKDVTVTAKEPLEYLMKKTNGELLSKSELPKQFVLDLHRLRGIILNGKMIASMEEAEAAIPKEVFKKLLEACGGNHTIAYRLTSMIVQTVFRELSATAILEAMPPTSPEYFDKHGPRWGIGPSGGCLFDIKIENDGVIKIEEARVILVAKSDYALRDGSDEVRDSGIVKQHNPGAIIVKRTWTIPLKELGNPDLSSNPLQSVQVNDSWTSVLKTDAYAKDEALRF